MIVVPVLIATMASDAAYGIQHAISQGLEGVNRPLPNDEVTGRTFVGSGVVLGKHHESMEIVEIPPVRPIGLRGL